jgi:hypothetical protein
VVGAHSCARLSRGFAPSPNGVTLPPTRASYPCTARIFATSPGRELPAEHWVRNTQARADRRWHRTRPRRADRGARVHCPRATSCALRSDRSPRRERPDSLTYLSCLERWMRISANLGFMVPGSFEPARSRDVRCGRAPEVAAPCRPHTMQAVRFSICDTVPQAGGWAYVQITTALNALGSRTPSTLALARSSRPLRARHRGGRWFESTAAHQSSHNPNLLPGTRYLGHARRPCVGISLRCDINLPLPQGAYR